MLTLLPYLSSVATLETGASKIFEKIKSYQDCRKPENDALILWKEAPQMSGTHQEMKMANIREDGNGSLHGQN